MDCSRVDRRDMSGCLVEGQGGGDSAWFMMMETGGSGRDEEEWEEWEEDGSGGGGGGRKGGKGSGRAKQSESERLALRLTDNYWDLEGLELALGSASASGAGRGGGGGAAWVGGCSTGGGTTGGAIVVDDDASAPLGAIIASKLAAADAAAARCSNLSAPERRAPEPMTSPETSRRRDAKHVRAMMSAIEREHERQRDVAAGMGTVTGAGTGGWSGRHKIEHCYKGRLNSCYASLCGGNEPPMTSCHGKFAGTVDYLWITDGLVAERVLMPPAVPSGKLPSEEYPSDHISIVADVVYASV